MFRSFFEVTKAKLSKIDFRIALVTATFKLQLSRKTLQKSRGNVPMLQKINSDVKHLLQTDSCDN